MTQITSHILDTSLGKPAEGVLVTLNQHTGADWHALGSASTDIDGRVADFIGDDRVLPAGTYKLTFNIFAYYQAMDVGSFYPQIDVMFEIGGDGRHYHVPLLLNPYGYSTYRGS